MNAPTLFDRARSFDILAPHLSEAKRAELAADLADRIVVDLPPARTRKEVRAAETLDMDASSPSRFAAEYLTRRGLTGVRLVNETLRASRLLQAYPDRDRVELLAEFVKGLPA